MLLRVIRIWEQPSFEEAVKLAVTYTEKEKSSGSGIRVVLVRRVTDPMQHHELVREHNLTIATFAPKKEGDIGTHKEVADAVRKYDKAVDWMKEAQDRTRIHRQSGKIQMVLEDTIVYVNNIPFMLRAGMQIEGNTDIKWAAAQEKPWEGTLDVAHNAEYIAQRREYDRLHPMPEMSDEDKQLLLKALYDSKGFEGYN